MSRIEQLKKFIAEDPSDPFPLYALALEYLHDDAPKAREVFGELLAKFPTYLPTYYPAAQASTDAGDDNEAARLYTEGIKLAAKLGERKTEAELRQAHQQWMMEKS